MKPKPIRWMLPRDPDAEQEALRLSRSIWGKEANVSWSADSGMVTVEVRTDLRHGSRLELSVRGDSSAQVTRRLVRCLRGYSSENL